MANICVGPTATGNGSGSDWNNQMQWSTLSFVRGNTYYLADGTYGGKTLSTAASGTTLITVKKAVVGDATAEAISGWVSTLGDGQATFTGTIVINSSYWVFDGVKGTGFATGIPDKNSANYGFLSTATNRVFEVFNNSAAITTITLSRTARIFSTSDIEKFFCATGNSTRAVNSLTISRCLSQNHGNFHWLTSPADDHNDGVIEYNVVLDVFSSSANHGEDFNNNFGTLVNFHYRYNWVEGTQNPNAAPTMIMGALNNDSGPLWIYGNVFKDKLFTDGGICAVLNGEGNHTLTGGVFHNTFINMDDDAAIIGGAGTNQMSAQNNLFVDMEVSEAISGTYSHNAYRNCASTPGGESNAQTLGSDPFTDGAGDDYSLTVALDDGAAVGAPYNVDVLGNTNEGRGAFAFVEQGGGEGVSGATAVCIAANGRVRGRR